MEFRRITGLPPYVFTIIDGLKVEARRAGVDVIDLGFGNPDLPSPELAVEKLTEAAHNPRNHRYSSSRGLPKLREAVSDLYLRRFGVSLDPDREVISTIGAKEGSLGRGAALFLGLLLTLIIVLYDRFRAVRRTEFEREAELLRARSAPATGAV